ncbi:MAG: MFS transporter [Deferrisomatales bacterium]|nr:MFS transporter [Deferrisomatales bacterium]
MSGGGPEPSSPRFLAALCAIAFGCYVAASIRIPVLPLYARSLGLDATEIGYINTGFFLVAGVLSVPLGMASDRVGRRVLVRSGLALLAVAASLLSVSTTYGQLLASYTLLGMGVAAFTPTMMSLVADSSPATHLGRAYGWYTTSLYVGMSVGPAVGGYLASHWGYRQAFQVSAGLLWGVFLLTWRFLARPGTASGVPSGRARPKTGIRETLANRRLLGCWVATVGGCYGLGMFLIYFPLHGRAAGLDAGAVGLVFFTQGLFNAVSRRPLGAWSDRRADRRPWVVLGMVGFATAMMALGFAGRSLWFQVVSVGLGVSMGLAFTSVGALTAEVVPPGARGIAMGGYNTSIFLGMMLNSATMGPVVDRAGFRAGFALAAGVIVGCAGLFWWLTPRLPARGAAPGGR